MTFHALPRLRNLKKIISQKILKNSSIQEMLTIVLLRVQVTHKRLTVDAVSRSLTAQFAAQLNRLTIDTVNEAHG